MRFLIYRADDGYRWQLAAPNNRLVAESGEAYTRFDDCADAVALVTDGVSRIADAHARGSLIKLFESGRVKT